MECNLCNNSIPICCLPLHNLNTETALFDHSEFSSKTHFFSSLHAHVSLKSCLSSVRLTTLRNKFVVYILLSSNSRSVLGPWPHTSALCGSLLLDGDGALDGSAAAGSWLTVTDLQPYTNYSFWIRGCNSQGCLTSPQISVTTPPAGKSNDNCQNSLSETSQIFSMQPNKI